MGLHFIAAYKHISSLFTFWNTKSRQELQSLPRPITWTLYSVVQPYDIECEDAKCSRKIFTPANKSIPQTTLVPTAHRGPRMWRKVQSDHIPSLPTSAITGGSFAEWRSARAYSTQINVPCARTSNCTPSASSFLRHDTRGSGDWL